MAESSTLQNEQQALTNLEFLPQKLRFRLMPFQRDGVKFAIEKNGRCLIADEMGLGKTLQALSVAYYYKQQWPLLIVVPSSLKYPWVEEIERYFPDIHPHEINMIQSGTDISAIPHCQISIVTFGIVRNPFSKVVQEALMNQKFEVVIVDESHNLKNRKSATTKYLVPLVQNADRKLLLTGTPALARPEELFPQLSALSPGLCGTWSNFAKRYCDARYKWFGRMKTWVTDGASNLEELQSLLSKNIMMRRLKKDVLKQLPPKQRQRIAFELKESNLKKDLDKTWIELSNALKASRGSMNQFLTTADSTEQASLFDVRRLVSVLYRDTAKAKIGPVKDYVKMLCSNADLKFLLFGYHHNMMDGVSEQLHDDNVKFIRIDGSTPQEDRPRLVHQYQVDPQTRVAILSMKAAGVGLTLTAAKLVVFAELDWTPGTLEQCEDRAHRIGQKETVHVHYLVAKGTLDEWVWSALEKKTTVITTTLNGKRQKFDAETGNEGQIQVLSNADAWVPPPKTDTDTDITEFFSPQPTNQKSMLDFFTPKGMAATKKKTFLDNMEEKMKAMKETDTREQNYSDRKGKVEDVDLSNAAIIIDEESDQNDFKTPKRKIANRSSNFKLSDIKVFKDERKRDFDMSDEEIDCDLPDVAVPKSAKRRRCEEKDNKANNELKCISTSTPIQKMQMGKKKESKYFVDEDDLKMNSSNVSSKEDCQASQIVKKPIEAKKWSCDICTFLNHDALLYCEMCSSPRVIHNTRKRAKPLLDVSPKIIESKKHSPQTEHLPRSSLHSLALLTELEAPTSKLRIHDISATNASISKACDTNLNGDSDTADFNIIEEYNSESESPLPGVKSVLDDSNHSTDDLFAQDDASDTCTIESYASDEKYSAEITGDKIDSKCKKEVMNDDMSTFDIDITDIIDDSNSSKEDSKEAINNLQNSEQKSPTKSSSQNVIHSDMLTPSRNTLKLSQHTPTQNTDLVSRESEAAKLLFSPKSKHKNSAPGSPWICCKCETDNPFEYDDCDGCFAPKSESVKPPELPKAREVDLDSVPVYDLFKFCCSKNSSRIYLYDKFEESLETNFNPLDVEVENFAELPDLLLHPKNLKLVKRFVREWNSLSATKRRLVVRHGELLINPCLQYQELVSGRKISSQRYATKVDVAQSSTKKAIEIGGTIRLVTRPRISPRKKEKRPSGTNPPSGSSEKMGMFTKLNETTRSDSFKNDDTDNRTELPNKMLDDQEVEKMQGLVQAVSADGTPLCIHCQSPYDGQLLTKKTMESNSWATRFCSKTCMETYWMQHHRYYSKQQVYQAEGGVCQICKFDAHSFYQRISKTQDLKKRADLIKESKYDALKGETKTRMVKHPVTGLFWHVDHIRAVFEGGGECDIDNLRTLCTVCHREVTAKQNTDRARQKKMSKAANMRDITAFFQPKTA